MQEFDLEEDAITGINVTPLVDITLVLLIIFMVTARFISEPSIGVSLPKSSSSSSGEVSEKNVFLTIDQAHQIYLNNSLVTQDKLGESIRQLLAKRPDLNLIVRADKNISHGEVISILDEVRSQGVTEFGIAVEGK
ncbi:biopolymer transporter ExbD [bacterium]|nr:biopolymer transporter ExbD [bacterium]MCI0606459.1 biopolymer transporter ExbD [bacterium]